MIISIIVVLAAGLARGLSDHRRCRCFEHGILIITILIARARFLRVLYLSVVRV